MRKAIIEGGDHLLLVPVAEGEYRLPEIDEVTDLVDSVAAEETFAAGTYTGFPIEKTATADYSGLGLQSVGVREAWNMLPADDYTAVTKLTELLNWNREQRFCPADGKALRREGEISKRCPGCGKEYFPLLFPAIVVLITKGEEALLVHARTLKRPVLTLVAGFVETGESLEECVIREIREETSLEVDDVRYFGSQSWPFPHQLMVGFTARYRSGALRFADGEITEGGFFTRDNLPLLPTMPSLSRRIIDAWAAGEL